jgi:selenocysteine-specific elongation factor
MPVIMGTAGHIDHGKTTLVKALTGIDTDRLEEEKRRGITIELGFAYLDLPDGSRLGVVDVPGHERFVKNMVAGAAGIDFVMLVIAADEGVMPQTREHLEICSLLGTSAGLVALTKTDMVDAEWLEMVKEDVGNFLKGTFLEGAPLMPVASTTGQGIPELKVELAKIAAGYRARRRSDLFRLPIDRIFTMKGYGTVITGTLVSGRIKVGEDIVVYPAGRPTKVRNLQSHGRSVEDVAAGMRTAVNLAGVELEDLARGDVLAAPGSLFPELVWDVELTLLGSSPKALKHRKEVHFHHGSRETMARVHLLDRDQLAPGETGCGQVRFTEPMVGVFGDRFVLRSFSPLRTIGGGRVLSPRGRRFKRFSEAVGRLAGLAEAGPEELVLSQLAMAGATGLTFAELLVMSNLETKALDKVLQDLGGRQQALCFDREARTYVSGALVEELSAKLLAFLAAFHAKEPLKPGVMRGELASTFGKALKPKLFHFLLERLVKKGEVASEAELLRLPGHKVSLASDQAKLKDTLTKAYVDGGLTPPNLKDVLDPLGLTFKEAGPVFKVLMESGQLVKVKEDMFFDAAALAGLKEKIVGFFTGNEEMGPVEFKDLTGLSRKYAIPLLEHFDKEKLTVRVGDKRRLRKR